ncbi:hypothetical protein VTJ83DRAFT_2115 [Remersonia thermophila]|uniref:Uncharacterized protein n=1 Tax=Remersonia thermophila TaxID=72144 RepID=A0ABR4DJB4_9PEZI
MQEKSGTPSNDAGQPSTSRAHETNHDSTGSSNSLLRAALQAPPLETLASDANRTHRTWSPTYGCVQRCDLCNERARGVLQGCTECSRRLCQTCVDKRIWWEDRRHYINPAACDWVIRKRPRGQNSQSTPAADDAAPPRHRRKLEHRQQHPAAETGGGSSSRSHISWPGSSAPARYQTSDDSRPAEGCTDGARRVAAGALLRMREDPVQEGTIGGSSGAEGETSAAGQGPSPQGEGGVERDGLISEVYAWIYGEQPRLGPRRLQTQIPALPLQSYPADNYPRGYGGGPYGAEGGPSTCHDAPSSAPLTHGLLRPSVSEFRPAVGMQNPKTSLQTDMLCSDTQFSPTAGLHGRDGHDSAIQPAGAGVHAVPPGPVQAYSYDHGYNTPPPVHWSNEHELDLQTLSEMRRAWDINPTLLRMRLRETREQYPGSAAAAALHALGLLWDVFEARRARLGGALPAGPNLETVRWFMHERDAYAALANRDVENHGQQHWQQLAPPGPAYHHHPHPSAYRPHYQQPYRHTQVQPAYQLPPERRHNRGYSSSSTGSGQRHAAPTSHPLPRKAPQPHRPEHSSQPDGLVRDGSTAAAVRGKQPRPHQDPDPPRHLQRHRLPFRGSRSETAAAASDPAASASAPASAAFSAAVRARSPVLPAGEEREGASPRATPATPAAAVKDVESDRDEPPVIVISDDSDGVKEEEKKRGGDENRADKMEGVTYP